MKYFILILSFMVYINSAYAIDDFTDIKSEVSDKLNETVAILKEYFKKTHEDLIKNKESVESAKEKAEALKSLSTEKETNPVVLKHGLAAMPSCDITSEELYWTNDVWVCKKPTYGTDCYPAKDEYRYEQADGSIVCSKSPKGVAINYYWKFRGYALNCGSDARKAKIYSCNYLNKNNQEVEVADGYCSSKTKPEAAENICYADWQVGAWGACQADKNRYRTVTCPANHICQATQPTNVEACVTQWLVGGWGTNYSGDLNNGGADCNLNVRTVSCPVNHTCSGYPANGYVNISNIFQCQRRVSVGSGRESGYEFYNCETGQLVQTGNHPNYRSRNCMGGKSDGR